MGPDLKALFVRNCPLAWNLRGFRVGRAGIRGVSLFPGSIGTFLVVSRIWCSHGRNQLTARQYSLVLAGGDRERPNVVTGLMCSGYQKHVHCTGFGGMWRGAGWIEHGSLRGCDGLTRLSFVYTLDPGDRNSRQIKTSSCYIDKRQKFTIGKLALVRVSSHRNKEATFLAAQTWTVASHNPTDWREVWTNIQKNGNQWITPAHEGLEYERGEVRRQPMNNGLRTPPWRLVRTIKRKRDQDS